MTDSTTLWFKVATGSAPFPPLLPLVCFYSTYTQSEHTNNKSRILIKAVKAAEMDKVAMGHTGGKPD